MKQTQQRLYRCFIVGVITVAFLSVQSASFAFSGTRHNRAFKQTSFFSASITGGGNNIGSTSTQLRLSDEPSPNPQTFREAEVLGLKLMQSGNYKDALKAFKTGLQLPGTKADVIRSKRLQGPSPVGGSFGGTESQRIQSLDEFELQAAHYNMACAHAQLGEIDEAISCLETALEQGFDNFSTILGDPDLSLIKQEPGFVKLMSKYNKDERNGFFGLFGKS